MRGAPTRDGWLRQVLVREYNKTYRPGAPGGGQYWQSGVTLTLTALQVGVSVCVNKHFIFAPARAHAQSHRRDTSAHISHTTRTDLSTRTPVLNASRPYRYPYVTHTGHSGFHTHHTPIAPCRDVHRRLQASTSGSKHRVAPNGARGGWIAVCFDHLLRRVLASLVFLDLVRGIVRRSRLGRDDARQSAEDATLISGGGGRDRRAGRRGGRD